MKPDIVDNTLLFHYPDVDIRVIISNIHNGNFGALSGEIEIESPIGMPFIGNSTINLLDHNARYRLAEQAQKQGDFEQGFKNYHSTIEDAIVTAILWYRQGEPTSTIPTTKPDNFQKIHQLYPLIEYNHITTLFATGGSGKSLIAAYICALISQNQLNQLNFVPMAGPVLYLDWESTQDVFHKRIYAILQGLDIRQNGEDFPILYRRCTTALQHDITAIQDLCLEYMPAIIVIDSQLAAMAGDPDKSEGATLFFNSIRMLNTTTLILDHSPKESKTIYGSITKYNRSRSVFMIDAEQQPGEDEIILSLQHIKNNDGPLIKPMGIKITFHNVEDGTAEKIVFSKADLATTAELHKTMTICDRLIEALKFGPLTVKQIAEEYITDKTPNVIGTTLGNPRYTNIFVKLDEGRNCRWGLKN